MDRSCNHSKGRAAASGLTCSGWMDGGREGDDAAAVVAPRLAGEGSAGAVGSGRGGAASRVPDVGEVQRLLGR